jgi:hypothetical protein
MPCERGSEHRHRAAALARGAGVHYKVCSTFDSAPHIGSIGHAIDIGARIFGGWTPGPIGASSVVIRSCHFVTVVRLSP